MKIVSKFMQCSIVKMNLRHKKKTCRNKLTLLSGTFIFIFKEQISVFRKCFDQRNLSIERSIVLSYIAAH